MTSNTNLVQRAYTAIGHGDIKEVISLMTDHIEIHVPGPAAIPFCGTFRGGDGVGQFFQSIGASAEVTAFQPVEFIAGGEQVVVLGHESLTARATGRSWTTEWAMVWTIADGRISRLREFHETHAIAAAFD